MAELSRPMGRLYHTIGEDAVITLEGLELTGDQPPRLLGPNGTELVPEIRRGSNSVGLVLHDQDLPEGPYALVRENDTIAMIAMNFPRRESDLSAYTPEQLEQELAQRQVALMRRQVVHSPDDARAAQAQEGEQQCEACVLDERSQR